MAWRTLCERFPRLVVVSTTFFGTDSLLSRLARRRSGRDPDERSRLRNAVQPGDRPAQPAAAQGPRAPGRLPDGLSPRRPPRWRCCSGRKRTGKGQHVDVSQWLAIVSTIRINVGEISHDTPKRRDVSAAVRTRKTGAGWIYPCRDGYISFRNNPENFWAGTVRMLGSRNGRRTTLFSTEFARLRNSDALDALLTTGSCSAARKKSSRLAQAQGVPCFPLYNIREVAENRQYQAREFFQECDHPVAGRFRSPGSALSDEPHPRSGKDSGPSPRRAQRHGLSRTAGIERGRVQRAACGAGYLVASMISTIARRRHPVIPTGALLWARSGGINAKRFVRNPA